MAHILITSGPTRQYLDPVRYLTNASSGKMGASLAAAAIKRGHRVTIVSGSVHISYPDQADVVWVLTTQEMMDAVASRFPNCDGLIGAAAPCDYQPRRVSEQKMAKTGEAIQLELIETPDVVASMGASKKPKQWVVGFALETEDQRFRAISKMQRKCCDMMVSNGPQAIDADENEVEILDKAGTVLQVVSGSKPVVAQQILAMIDKHLL